MPASSSAARPGCGVTLVLDAGAFVAAERGDRDVVALVRRECLAGRVPVTSGEVVAQVWRGGTGRQAPLARLLAGTDLMAVDDDPVGGPGCCWATAASRTRSMPP